MDTRYWQVLVTVRIDDGQEEGLLEELKDRLKETAEAFAAEKAAVREAETKIL